MGYERSGGVVEPSSLAGGRYGGVYAVTGWRSADRWILGKFYVFTAAWLAGIGWITVIGVIIAAIAAFYYLRIVAQMFMAEPVRDTPCRWITPCAQGWFWQPQACCCWDSCRLRQLIWCSA